MASQSFEITSSRDDTNIVHQLLTLRARGFKITNLVN